MKTVRGLLVIASIFFICKVSQAQSNELVKVPQNSKNGNPRGYIQYLPQGFDTSGATKYPVLYWLHGLGDKGSGSSTDLEKILNTQICLWLKSNRIDFIVVVPQDIDGYWNGTPTRLKSFVDWANLEYGKYINTGQQHLAGLSGGGYGIRDFIIENSAAYKAFSTLTFMSTNVNAINTYAKTIVDNNQKVWFHQGADDVMPNTVNDVKTLHNNIYAFDATRSRLTVYTGVGHFAWDKVYNGAGMTSDQLTGTIAGTTYYPWTLNDIDRDWYGWMKASGKSPVTGDSPSLIRLTNFTIEENNKIDVHIGSLSANGHRPVVLALMSGVEDNDLFYISNNELVAKAVFDFELKNEYTVMIEATNDVGSISKKFTVTVQDINEDAITDTEDGSDSSINVRVFPNPVIENQFYLEASKADIFVSTVEIMNVRGEKKEITLNGFLCQEIPYQIDISNTPGLYFLRINYGTKSELIKVVKIN